MNPMPKPTSEIRSASQSIEPSIPQKTICFFPVEPFDSASNIVGTEIIVTEREASAYIKNFKSI